MMKPYRKGARWYGRVVIRGEIVALGGFDSEEDAVAFTRQVEERHPDRLLRPKGSVRLVRYTSEGSPRYMARKTVKGRRIYVGVFQTSRAAWRAMATALAMLSVVAGADAASVSSTLTIKVSPGALVLVLNPSSATEACNVAGGTLVSQASASGGDGNAITWSMTGDTADFAINATTGAVTVVPAGIALADCNMSYANTITATQP